MRTLLLFVIAFTGSVVHAQAVYRCGPDGRSYSQTPCAQGRAIEVNDERSLQQRREATEAAKRDRVLGNTLEQDRLARETQSQAGAGKIDGRTGYAKVAAHAEPAKHSTKSKKRSRKTPQQPDRYKAVSATRP